MDDFERYGDYNEIEDEQPKKNILGLVLKIVSGVVCAAVIGIIGLRLFTFNYYPDSMKRLYFTDALTEHYVETGGNIGALTQKLRAPYDDADRGNFFCDRLIVIPDIGELQVALRYNVSIASSLADNYGLSDFDAENTSQFSFRLWRNGSDGGSGSEIGTITAALWDSYAMYRYCKLVFDGVDFGLEEGEDKIEWIRLEIFIEGIEEPFMVAVYENNDDYASFSEYKLSKGEAPQ